MKLQIIAEGNPSFSEVTVFRELLPLYWIIQRITWFRSVIDLGLETGKVRAKSIFRPRPHFQVLNFCCPCLISWLNSVLRLKTSQEHAATEANTKKKKKGLVYSMFSHWIIKCHFSKTPQLILVCFCSVRRRLRFNAPRPRLDPGDVDVDVNVDVAFDNPSYWQPRSLPDSVITLRGMGSPQAVPQSHPSFSSLHIVDRGHCPTLDNVNKRYETRPYICKITSQNENSPQSPVCQNFLKPLAFLVV